MSEIVPFLGTLPGWGLTIVLSLILLNYLANGKIGEIFAGWIGQRVKSYDRNQDALLTILRETTKELSVGVDRLDERMEHLEKVLGEGQASLAVKQAEIRGLVSSQNLHHTGHHEQLSSIISKIEVLTEKVEGLTLLLMQLTKIARKE